MRWFQLSLGSKFRAESIPGPSGDVRGRREAVRQAVVPQYPRVGLQVQLGPGLSESENP